MTEQQIVETLAVKVMGWRVLGGVFHENGILIDYWNPLQNIADAWMIVEKLKDNFTAWYISNTTDGWCCQFINLMPTESEDSEFTTETIDGEGKTAQEAICKAALKVVA